ncbi:MAG: PhoH family protein [Gammaproteobacteria bacterium]|nr:PhoH family protein [Gammaproteobacteria bacterium]
MNDTTKARKSSKAKPKNKRLFVLDTNVLMHDPTCLFRFEEHDIYLPMVVLEELDNAKKGTSEIAYNVRQVSRFLDEVMADATKEEIDAGLPLPAPLKATESGVPPGRVYFQTRTLPHQLQEGLLPGTKADNAILGTALGLQEERPDITVTVVSKDINLRIKAAVVGIRAEDYHNDKVLEDVDLLYSGSEQLPDDFWEKHGEELESWQEEGRSYYRIHGPLTDTWYHNQCIYLEGENGFEAMVRGKEPTAAIVEYTRDFRNERNAVWGITARNREQNFALNLLMDPDIDFVTLVGVAGTGKTLLTLAAGLAQVLEDKRYKEIIMTRVTVPVGEDIGFLPGTEEEKMTPWMGALMDNLEVLTKTDMGGDWGRMATNDLLHNRIKIRSLNFMRGRTFLEKFIIIDEAQNLTAKQMKTLITRAGPGTKVICLGNLGQIDTPYITETTSGLTYVVDRFKNWEHSAHTTLMRGERSRLADYATQVL